MTYKNGVETIPVKPDLILRPYDLDHSIAIFQLIDRNREHLSQYGDTTSAKYRTVEDVADSISNQNPLRRRYGIWRGSVLIGTVNVEQKLGNGTSEIGYYLDVEYQGKGCMSKVVRAMTNHSFQVMDVPTLFGRGHLSC
ncbi:MAG: GNAT family N-acetyltransferase [Candidatus Woesearchaeota archaeon]